MLWTTNRLFASFAILLSVTAVTQAAEFNVQTFAAVETPEQTAICYKICERSFTEVLAGPDRDSLKECEGRQKCVSRLQLGPDHGYTAGVPRDQLRDLQDIFQDLIGVDRGEEVNG